MDSPYSPLEFTLLNDWQRDFPIVARPFEEVAARIARSGIQAGNADAEGILSTLLRLRQRGAVSRVGAVLAPRRIGASTLAALCAPAGEIERIAALVSARPEVNHNYQREHRYNLWFVATAADHPTLALALRAIEEETACKVISLPLETEYHIDLGFDLHSPHKHHAQATTVPIRELDAIEKRLIAALQPGLDLVPRPFSRLGETCGLGEDEVLTRVAGWLEEGLIKRFGVIVRHHELGYRANAMVVFDLPDDEVDRVGSRFAAEPGVTLCYRRARSLPEWTYNLYCMVHGRSREEVRPVIERLGRIAGMPGNALFSTRRFKQCGARYYCDSSANA